MELIGKRIIIITGAARGLGKYMAIACIRSGAQVLAGFGDQMLVPTGGMLAQTRQ